MPDGSPNSSLLTSSTPRDQPPSAWSPLRIAVFRSLWIATVVSNIGTWAQEAGGPWLMNLLRPHNPAFVALVAVAENLPICLLSLPAGALADVIDRRRLLIFTQIWMLAASGLLGVLTLFGWATPSLLLTFTALLGVGIALSGPAFQAIVPELVPPGDMPLAVALNSVALNVARAIGPALGMVVVIAAGAGTRGPGASFLLNAASFVGVAAVLYRWKRPRQEGHAHAEQLWGAVKLGFHFTRYSPPMQAILIRVAAFILCAVAMWAELPVIASDQLHRAEDGYGILMACLGTGAVIGVIMMPRLQKKLNIDGMVVACTGLFALGLIGLGMVRNAWLAYSLMLFIGFNWVIIPTNFNVATQRSVPNWVKGRALSMYLTTLFGSWALGSAFWGAIARHTSVSTALVAAGVTMGASLLLVTRLRLTMNKGQDFTPAFAGKPLEAIDGLDVARGAIEARVVHRIAPQQTPEFVSAMKELRLQRLRNGAIAWRLEPQNGEPGEFAEIYRVESWAECARHHSRTTKADIALQEKVRSFHLEREVAAKPELRAIEPAIGGGGRSEPLEGRARRWIADQMAHAVDRVLEELEIIAERILSKSKRGAPK